MEVECWYMPVIPVIGTLRWDFCGFGASLAYAVNPRQTEHEIVSNITHPFSPATTTTKKETASLVHLLGAIRTVGSPECLSGPQAAVSGEASTTMKLGGQSHRPQEDAAG